MWREHPRPGLACERGGPRPRDPQHRRRAATDRRRDTGGGRARRARGGRDHGRDRSGAGRACRRGARRARSGSTSSARHRRERRGRMGRMAAASAGGIASRDDPARRERADCDADARLTGRGAPRSRRAPDRRPSRSDRYPIARSPTSLGAPAMPTPRATARRLRRASSSRGAGQPMDWAASPLRRSAARRWPMPPHKSSRVPRHGPAPRPWCSLRGPQPTHPRSSTKHPARSLLAPRGSSSPRGPRRPSAQSLPPQRSETFVGLSRPASRRSTPLPASAPSWRRRTATAAASRRRSSYPLVISPPTRRRASPRPPPSPGKSSQWRSRTARRPPSSGAR